MRLTSFFPIDDICRKNDYCHVIVCGNEKGGSGKSTTAIHIAVGLQEQGFAVACVDLDVRQRTLARHIENRHAYISATGCALQAPPVFLPDLGHGVRRHHTQDFADDMAALPLEPLLDRFDFIVIDTPGSFTRLSELAHRQADTLLTPLNDSFIDFDMLARIDPESFEVIEISTYAREVRAARRFRQSQGNGILDWLVVRNRMAQFTSRNEQRVDGCLRDLAGQLGFRMAHGIGERVIFREFFHAGLTALDPIRDARSAVKPSMSHIAARTEVRNLINALHLPVDEAGRKRAETRRNWLSRPRPKVQLPDVFASVS